ncbi:MAG TPA: hypothetical protein VMT51_04650 [Dongiaceae bacterium]|nr:hypothetical protein [Dongiaceae bacterium]
MRTVYYSWTTNAAARAGGVALAVSLCAAGAVSSQQPAARTSLTTASLDAHDGLTVAADPWLSADRYKETFPKKSPYAAGVLAVKVTLRNDSDESIRIGIERIRLNLTFDDNNRQELPALTSERVADVVLRPKLKGGNKPRLPIPLPSSPGGRDKNWQQFQQLVEDAGVHDAIIAPHKAISGLLYFDLQGQFDLLANARLYIPDLTTIETHRTLLYFDIDLSHPSGR